MQLHVHSQIAHAARTVTDGKWRAPDSLGYNEHLGAVAAIVSQHLEEALTRRFGLEWLAGDDGHGFEIKGISGEMMRLFSSRRESITADLRARAARFEQRYGRKPSERELAQLAQASNFKTRNAKRGALDAAQLHAGWATATGGHGQQVTVTPATGLQSGQQVQVQASGFAPSESLVVTECAAKGTATGPRDCDLTGMQGVTSDASGRVKIEFTITKGPFGANNIVCSPAQACLISVTHATPSPTQEADAPIATAFPGTARCEAWCLPGRSPGWPPIRSAAGTGS